MREFRSGSQILFGYLPEQTVDLGGRVWKVKKWNQTIPAAVDETSLRNELVRQAAAWERNGTDGEFVNDMRRGVPVHVQTLNTAAGVEVEPYPRVWICKRCQRVSSDADQPCRCGGRTWGQFHFVGFHDCGALREPWIPRCRQHNQARIRFPGTSSAAEIIVDCPECNTVLRRGMGMPNCNCENGRVTFTVHRAARVYTPRNVVIVNPPTPQRVQELRDAGGIMDAATGQLTATDNYGFLPEVATAVSDDGEHVATATAARMRIFDGEVGTLVREFPVPKMNSQQLIWQPHGKLLLRVDRRSEENPDRLILVDSETGKTAYQLIGHDEEIFWACWSPDGKQVASAGNDGTCRIWDAANGKQVRSLVHDDPLWWVVWDPSGAKIATGSAFSAITVWDASDGKQLREFKTLSKPLPKPTLQRATDTPFAFLKNPNQIFYMAGSGFEMLDVSSGQITSLGKASIPGGDRLSIGWSPDFKTMGLYCGYGEFHLIKQGEEKSVDVRYFRSPHWLPKDSRLLGGDNRAAWVSGYDYRRHRRLGVILPELPQNAWATLGSDGHFVGSQGIESHIVVVAMHEDGRLMTLTPAEFSEHFGWKNDPNKVRFIK